MKRSEIKVGQDYAWSTWQDWKSNRVQRIRVIDAGDWATDKSDFGLRPPRVRIALNDGSEVTISGVREARHGTKPNAVIAELLDDSGTPVEDRWRRYEAVPYTQIRATWAEGSRIVEEQRAADRQASEAADRKRAETIQRVQATRTAASSLGLDSSTWFEYRDGEVRLPIDALERLVALAGRERLGWVVLTADETVHDTREAAVESMGRAQVYHAEDLRIVEVYADGGTES